MLSACGGIYSIKKPYTRGSGYKAGVRALGAHGADRVAAGAAVAQPGARRVAQYLQRGHAGLLVVRPRRASMRHAQVEVVAATATSRTADQLGASGVTSCGAHGVPS